MKTTIKLLAIVVLAIYLSGCANVVSGKTQSINFQTKPEITDVYINGLKVGQTPLVTQVIRKEATNVTFKADGYEDSTIQLPTKTNPWLWGNVLWSYFSTIGTTVDVSTGASIEYEPNMYFTTLLPKGKTQLPAGIMDKDSKISRFVVVNYKALGSDLSSEKGEYLDGLLALIKIAPEKRGETIQLLKKLYVDSESAPKYAQEIEAKFPSN